MKNKILTAAPTDKANVPNISDKGTSPPYPRKHTFFRFQLEKERDVVYIKRRKVPPIASKIYNKQP